MTHKNVNPAPVVQQLIDRFLIPAPGRSPEKIKASILRWVAVANAERSGRLRRLARQNVRRLAQRHPGIAAEILATVKPGCLQ
jgi:hypothetical protein